MGMLPARPLLRSRRDARFGIHGDLRGDFCAETSRDDGGAAPTDFIQYVQPPPGVDSCGSNCYPAADYLRDKIASPGQASEYEWNTIAQSVGNLADKILAQLC